LIFNQEETVIRLEKLSSGEKQLLIILFTVFLMEEKPFIVLMDEPEISLHIGWQQQLIDVIRQVNPHCQLIIATHSPSIFGEGWGNKIFFVEDLIQ
jgi:predicted ATPase